MNPKEPAVTHYNLRNAAAFAPTSQADPDAASEQLLRSMIEQLADAHALSATLRDECSSCRKQIQFSGSNTATDRHLLPAWRDGSGWPLCEGPVGNRHHVPTYNKPGR